MTDRMRYAPGTALGARYPGWTDVPEGAEFARAIAEASPNEWEIDTVGERDEYGTEPLPLE